MSWFEEALYVRTCGYRQGFLVEREVARLKTEFQEMAIFESPFFGRVLALDGIVQTTERDEFVYHEMMAHVPLLAHGGARDVLIIGGGDGGVLREVLRHPVERATLVEIDGGVVDFCRRHMPGLSAGAFDDPRTELLIVDGIRYVAETTRRFDLIIIDSTDPVGPGEGLFTDAFYADCKTHLNPGGLIVTQSGVPFFQPDELRTTVRRLRPLFADVACYLIAVPTYVGGLMALGWGSDDPALRGVGEEVLAERQRAAGIATRYYAPAVHRAAFRLPPFVAELLA